MKFNKFLYIMCAVSFFFSMACLLYLSAENVKGYEIQKMDNNAVVFVINNEIFIYADEHLYIATQWHHAADCPNYCHDYE